ncbi:hypothetical protein SLEP1_g48565 [Rubroshorea leprosula]|uniref:Disease resistance protein At4g27190-like leucine-rich repeats domain-containing protein n=1 Tax=Rubroshorea leprosula TaxID=152421 RepID=A0AAV5LU79_9ROSI|nr:hypothetical protein SLEP1_g48565 [Rubroshorea leprosula]
MNPQEFLSFRQLTSFEICNVSNLTYLLTPSMVMELVELMQLVVKNCKMMERIITGGAENIEENKLIFHQLKVITLESCSKLTSLSTGSYTLRFPSLLDVIIADWFKVFHNSSKGLWYVVVRRWKRYLIGTEGLIEEKGKMSLPLFPWPLFPKLDSMVLEDLPELTRFCCESQAPPGAVFVFPQVTYLKFSKLPKLKSFFPQNATEWPLLAKMQLIGCKGIET